MAELQTERSFVVELTPEGEKLYSHVAAAVEQIQYGEEELCLERTLAKGVVTIGASEIALRCYLLPVLKNFRQKYPCAYVYSITRLRRRYPR